MSAECHVCGHDLPYEGPCTFCSLLERALAAEASLEAVERERDEARAELERVREVARRDWQQREGGPLPRTDNLYYDLRQRLNRAVRWLREAEDLARLEMPARPAADRIRSIYEQVSEDVLNGKTTIPPVLERLRAAEARVRELEQRLATEGLPDDLLRDEGEGYRGE